MTLVWVANIYMSLFGRLRLDIKRERVAIKAEEIQVEQIADAPPGDDAIPQPTAGARR